jgi:hypothetical protein
LSRSAVAGAHERAIDRHDHRLHAVALGRTADGRCAVRQSVRMGVVGVAAVVGTGLLAAPATATGGPIGGSGSEYLLNDTFTGTADTVFTFGDPGDDVQVGDWNGDGRDTLMVRRGNTFSVRNSNSSGGADAVFSYGDPGDTVLAGDWDGDGADSLAVRRGTTFYVRNSLSSGIADAVVSYGDPGDTVLVGDWDGDRADTLAVRRGAQTLVRNSLTSGVADAVVTYGDPGDTVLVGRWSSGQTGDTLGVRRGNSYLLRNSLTSGPADTVVGYGDPGDTAFVGDWNGDGIDTLGVRRPAPGPAAFGVTGLDLHEGMMLQAGGVYYLYGTRYACGFRWLTPNTPWCGLGVSTSTDKVHWSTPRLLFDPNSVDTWNGQTWQQVCGGTGAGCFNPRMIHRSGWGADDGAWILWFNAPQDWNATRANAYYAMGCEGPAGPCGAGDGGPLGSTHKPALGAFCTGNGDFQLVTPPSGRPVAICTEANQTLSEARLDDWGTNGDGTGARDLAGLTGVESPGAYRDPATGTWILTYSDPNCGYCTGTATSYATAPDLLGPWTATASRQLSASSCGGQPRTISTIDGHPYVGVDLWVSGRDQTGARLHFEPLTYSGSRLPPFDPWHC